MSSPLHVSCTAPLSPDSASAGRPQQDLQSEIDRLAHEHGAPSFQPHVTLLPNIHSDEATVLQNAELLARRLEVCG